MAPLQVEAHWRQIGKGVPASAMLEDPFEDGDADGFVSWEEFNGPKGQRPQPAPGEAAAAQSLRLSEPD